MTAPVPTKLQKQRMLLLYVGGLLVAALLFTFGAQPLLNHERRLRVERQTLDGRIEEAERLLKEESTLRAEWENRRDEINSLLHRSSPPAANPLLWASEFVYRHARATGVNVESLMEMKSEIPAWAKAAESRPDSESANPAPRKKPSAPPRRFVPYGVQVLTACGYNELKDFLRSMETDNPLISIVILSIASREKTPEKHLVRLALEWPRLQESLQQSFADITSGK